MATFALWLGVAGCDHGLEADPPAPTGVAGRLTFVGAWPATVEQVAVVVYQDMPQTLADFYPPGGWDTEVSLEVQTYSYFIPIENEGVYRWVIVVWREQGKFWDFNSLLGCYHVRGDTLPTPVAVHRREITRGIDITVDFGILEGEEVPGHSVCERGLSPELLALRRGE